jgi:hypothetical protein
MTGRGPLRRPSRQPRTLQYLDVWGEGLQVTINKGAVDLHQGFLVGEVDCQCHEEALQAGVDDKGARCRVHASNIPANPNTILSNTVH